MCLFKPLFWSQYIVFQIAKPKIRIGFAIFLCNFIFKKLLTNTTKYAIIKTP